MTAGRSSIHQLTDNGGQNWSPAWRPVVQENGYTNIWVMTFEGPNYGACFDVIVADDGNIMAVWLWQSSRMEAILLLG